MSDAHTCINVLDTIRVGQPSEVGDTQVDCAESGGPGEDGAGVGHESALPGVVGAHPHGKHAACEVHGAGGLAGPAVVLPHTAAPDIGRVPEDLRTTAHHAAGVHQAIATLTTALSNITGDRELSSVWSTAIRPLVLYNDPLIARSTDTSTFPLEDFQYGAGGRSLYLVAPSPRALTRLHPLYRVVLDVAMARLMDHKVRSWQQRLLVCADESRRTAISTRSIRARRTWRGMA